MRPLVDGTAGTLSLDILPTITVLFAGILVFVYLALTVRVIAGRVRHRQGLGDGGHKDLLQAIRAHGNFAEYVPFGLLLLAFVEMAYYASWVVWSLGGLLLAGRVIHAIAISINPGPGTLRVIGMVATLLALSAGGALCILAFVDI